VEDGWFFRETEGSPTLTKNSKKQIARNKQFQIFQKNNFKKENSISAVFLFEHLYLLFRYCLSFVFWDL